MAESSKIKELLIKTPKIKEALAATGEQPFPHIKTIHKNPEFIFWKNDLIYELQQLKQQQIVIEILDLLQNRGFKNGFSDEKDFRELEGKLSVISEHLTELTIDAESVVNKQAKLEKNTQIETIFDTYTLVEQVGSGGNARVFSAMNSDNELVAIKFVEKNISRDKLNRFKNEIHFCENHNHKNIVKIIDRGQAYIGDKNYLFYIMPLYNKTLRKRIKEGISPEEAVEIFIGLMHGLEYAHNNGTIHRDIKPENIMFELESTEPIICDFGIAHFSEDEMLTLVETEKSDRMANFQYRAPEQIKKNGTTYPQTDIYSAALILNEMFTKEIPQANGYKTIAQVNSEYAFLDKLFEMIYKQNPEDRLYPEDEILTTLQVLIDNKNEQKTPIAKSRQNAEYVIKKTEIEKSSYHNTQMEGVVSFDFKNNSGKYIIGNGEYEFVTNWSECGINSIYAYKDNVKLIGYLEGQTRFPNEKDFSLFDFTSRTRQINVGEVLIWMNNNNKFAATLITNVSSKSRGKENNNLSFTYKIYP